MSRGPEAAIDLARLREVLEAIDHHPPRDASDAEKITAKWRRERAVAARNTLWPALLAVADAFGRETPGHHPSCCVGLWSAGKRSRCLRSCAGYRLRAAIREHLGDL